MVFWVMEKYSITGGEISEEISVSIIRAGIVLYFLNI
jgi:hypothetical protein